MEPIRRYETSIESEQDDTCQAYDTADEHYVVGWWMRHLDEIVLTPRPVEKYQTN